MKYIFIFMVFLATLFMTTPLFATAYAIEDPLSRPNNKIGIHILFVHELEEAAKLVNANGGAWGFVTIPIQSGDRDIEKWQGFMNQARDLKVTPIIRLATEGDYFNTKVWRKPKAEDVIDFANFLNSLEWPTKNRYIIIFNEVNRGDEYGGAVDPSDYAELLSYSVSVFKSKNPDFFVISSGMDNAAPNQGREYMNQYDYMRAMHVGVPGIFNQIDGLGSHSYPNPAFSQPPSSKTTKSIISFAYERDLAESLSQKKLPIFITETGWTSEKINDDQRATYYTEAFTGAWSDEGIVAITPFLFRAGGGPFTIFTFIKDDGSKTKQYDTFFNLPKTEGKPTLNQITMINPKVLGESESHAASSTPKDFSQKPIKKRDFTLSQALQGAFKWIMKL